MLATVQADGAPLAMPMWFLHDPTALTMISVAGTQKVRNLRRDPRVCVVAEGGCPGDVRGVSVHGRAEFLADGPERRALAERFVEKYQPAPRAALGRPGHAGRPRDVPDRAVARAKLGARLSARRRRERSGPGVGGSGRRSEPSATAPARRGAASASQAAVSRSTFGAIASRTRAWYASSQASSAGVRSVGLDQRRGRSARASASRTRRG